MNKDEVFATGHLATFNQSIISKCFIILTKSDGPEKFIRIDIMETKEILSTKLFVLNGLIFLFY